MNKAIVFNCGFNGLSIIQDLGQKGVECVAMDPHRTIPTFSKYAKYVRCPDPANDERGFIEFLYNYCSSEPKKPVLFPTNDHYAMAISKYKSKLSKVAIPCVCDYNTIMVILDKRKFYLFCKKKYCVPKSWSFKDINKINTFPIVAKPFIRRFSSNRSENICRELDKIRLTVLRNKSELIQYLNKTKHLAKYIMFQEYIPGMSDSMYTIGLYANPDHKIKILFTGHKVRGYPAEYGDCIVGESFPLPKKVIFEAKKLITELKYTGIAEIEYKYDTDRKKFYLLEMNPRSWSWIGITSKMERSIPYYAYLDLIGIKQKNIQSKFKAGEVKYVKFIPDFLNCMFRYKWSYPHWDMSLLQWIRQLDLKKSVIAEFNAKDYKITLLYVLNILFGFLKKIGWFIYGKSKR